MALFGSSLGHCLATVYTLALDREYDSFRENNPAKVPRLDNLINGFEQCSPNDLEHLQKYRTTFNDEERRYFDDRLEIIKFANNHEGFDRKTFIIKCKKACLRLGPKICQELIDQGLMFNSADLLIQFNVTMWDKTIRGMEGAYQQYPNAVLQQLNRIFGEILPGIAWKSKTSPEGDITFLLPYNLQKTPELNERYIKKLCELFVTLSPELSSVLLVPKLIDGKVWFGFKNPTIEQLKNITDAQIKSLSEKLAQEFAGSEIPTPQDEMQSGLGSRAAVFRSAALAGPIEPAPASALQPPPP